MNVVIGLKGDLNLNLNFVGIANGSNGATMLGSSFGELAIVSNLPERTYLLVNYLATGKKLIGKGIVPIYLVQMRSPGIR